MSVAKKNMKSVKVFYLCSALRKLAKGLSGDKDALVEI